MGFLLTDKPSRTKLVLVNKMAALGESIRFSER